MRKRIVILLSFAVALSSLLTGNVSAAAKGPTVLQAARQTALRAEQQNLAEHYTSAGGQLSFNEMAQARNFDSTDNAVFGGYAWDMGVGETGAGTEPGRAVITTGKLEANTTYWFTYLYQKDFRVVFESVKDPAGTVVKQGYAANSGSVTYTDDIYDSCSSVTKQLINKWWQQENEKNYHRVALCFTTAAAGCYKINLKSSKTWPMENCEWDAARFSDLRLVKQTAGNLAAEVALGQNLTVSSNVALMKRDDHILSNGTAAYSLFGGQSWAFELNSDNTGVITYKANLEKNRVYTFSYIYANDYKIQMDTSNPVTGPDGNTVFGAAYDPQNAVRIAGNVNAYKVTVRFIALQSGEYTFNLGTQKAWGNDENYWTFTTLSDLQLYEEEAFAPFAELSYENAAAGLVGVSMRAGAGNVKQAMRFKSSVNKAFVATGVEGYTAVEYGSLVAGTETLGSTELTLNLVNSAIPALKGVAYHREQQPTPILWQENNEYATFTAALTNITVESSAKAFTVRPYIVLQKSEQSLTLYGEAQSASVFEVCKAILASGKADDIAAVNAIMAGNSAFKAAYNSWQTAEEPGALDPEAPVGDGANYLQLSVLNGQTPITKNYRGYSATIYHAFGFMEDESSGRVYTEKMRNDELKKLTNFGIRYARTRYPSDWTWDANRGWDFSRNRFGYFCNYAKALQQRGVQVVLQAGWHLGAITEIEDCSIGEVEYLKGRGVDRYAESYGLDFTGKSAEEQRMIKGARRYGYWLGQTLLQLRSRGIYNVNYISYFVEPSNFYSGYPAGNSNKEYVLICRASRNKLGEMGLENTVKHVGPNEVSGTGDELLQYVLKTDPELFDIYTAHTYPHASSVSSDEYANILTPSYQSYKNHMQNAGLWGKKEFWIDELDVKADDYPAQSDLAWGGLQNAVCGIVGQQLGMNNMLFWQLFDQLWTDFTSNGGEWKNGIHITGIVPSLFEGNTPRKQFYTFGPFVKYNGYQKGKVYQTNNNALMQNHESLYLGAAQLEDGKWTISVVNNGSKDRPVEINFEKALNQTLYRHRQTASSVTATPEGCLARADATYLQVKGKLRDVIPAGSIVIYTGVKG